MSLDAPPAPAGAGSKGRRGGLIAFGVVVVLLGCLCGLAVRWLLLANGRPGTAPSPSPRGVMFSSLMLGALGVTFVWLGIGSILARRWARALLAVLSGWLLAFGISAVVFLALVMPRLLDMLRDSGRDVPPGATAILVLFTASVFVLLPGAMVLFYGSRSVQATCEARDPIQRWTDACPPSILALSLMYGIGALLPIAGLVFGDLRAPFFGVLLSGGLATLFTVVTMLLSGWCAWALYRLSLAGWWVMLVSQLLFAASIVITLARMGPGETARFIGAPAESSVEFPVLRVLSRGSIWLMIVSSVACVGYALWIRKHFRPRAPGAA